MPIPLILAPILAKLATGGLDLITSAVLAKGKDVVEKELNVDLASASTDELRQKQMDHEEKLLEMALEDRKLDLEYYKVDAADRDSARSREVHVLESDTDWFNKSIASVLALVTVIGGGCFLYWSQDSDIKYGVIALMSSVMTYYFGSNKQSAQKDAAINKLSQRG